MKSGQDKRKKTAPDAKKFSDRPELAEMIRDKVKQIKADHVKK